MLVNDIRDDTNTINKRQILHDLSYFSFWTDRQGCSRSRSSKKGRNETSQTDRVTKIRPMAAFPSSLLSITLTPWVLLCILSFCPAVPSTADGDAGDFGTALSYSNSEFLSCAIVPTDCPPSKTKQNKTKRNETKRNETKRNETKRNETKRNETKRNESKAKQSKAKQSKAKQSKAKQSKAKQSKTSRYHSMLCYLIMMKNVLLLSFIAVASARTRRLALHRCLRIQ
jgi:hypothetical protein